MTTLRVTVLQAQKCPKNDGNLFKMLIENVYIDNYSSINGIDVMPHTPLHYPSPKDISTHFRFKKNDLYQAVELFKGRHTLKSLEEIHWNLNAIRGVFSCM